ncbi:MAG: 50S ribosomal protein L22 [Firmicutes bacterium]|nr:50S ribosomal protein L22 [Bacillota bacterium]MCL2770822.1 50S ribosomal protein L22 [Bacillota bacterium]
MATRSREKALKREETRDKRAKAITRHVRITPSKVGEVLALIRGKEATEAQNILTMLNKGASEVVLKTLESAIANAENNLSLTKEELFVAECFAGAGPIMKRLVPRARGRADIMDKRTSHITIILDRVAK